jgi:hypothetical protein
MMKRLAAKFITTQGPPFLQAELFKLFQACKHGELDVPSLISSVQHAIDVILGLSDLNPEELRMVIEDSLTDFKNPSYIQALERPKVELLRLQVSLGMELLRIAQPEEVIVSLAEVCEKLRIALSLAGTSVNFNTYYAEELLERYKTRVAPAVLQRLGGLLELEADTEAVLSRADICPQKRRGADFGETQEFKRPVIQSNTPISMPHRQDRMRISKEVKLVKLNRLSSSGPARQAASSRQSSSGCIQELVQVAQRAFYKPDGKAEKVLVKASPIKPQYSEGMNVVVRSIFRS